MAKLLFVVVELLTVAELLLLLKVVVGIFL